MILLNIHNFKIRLNCNVTVTEELKKFVVYVLYRYKCPFHVQDKSNYLLLAFGFLMNHIDLFGKYDMYFVTPPTGITSIETLNSLSEEFIRNNMTETELTWSSLLNLHKKIVTELRSTYAQLYYSASLITKVHDTDPSLDPEDIWISTTEERIQTYSEIMSEAERIDQRKEEELKLRANFWKWIEGTIDTVDDVAENNTAEACSVEFSKVLESIEQNFKFICSVWGEIEGVMSNLDKKMRGLIQEMPECGLEIEKVFKEMSGKFCTFEDGVRRIRESGEIPTVVPIVSGLVKERSENDVVLAKKVDGLLQDLNKVQNNTKIAVYKVMNNVSGVKTYGL